MSDSIVELSDGKLYYHIKAALPASGAAREINLLVSVKMNDTVANGSFTFSIPKYASGIISDADYEPVEKYLIKDILAYIRSAYVYFNSEDKNAVVSMLNLYDKYFSQGSINLDASWFD